MKDWFDFIFPDYGLIETRYIKDGEVRRWHYTDKKVAIKDATYYDGVMHWDPRP